MLPNKLKKIYIYFIKKKTILKLYNYNNCDNKHLIRFMFMCKMKYNINVFYNK